MAFSLPDLPYAKNALSPFISEETLDYHHGKHHQAYVTNLNNLIQNTPQASKSLVDIIKSEKEGSIFNNAAQVWNHTFYWHSMGKKCGGDPHGNIADAIKSSFGSFEEFKNSFSKAALGQFGSGWAWLTQDQSTGKLLITTTGNAHTPLTSDKKPILTCDVWEHAYYIDYRNARAKYIDAWWNLVSWDFANNNLA